MKLTILFGAENLVIASSCKLYFFIFCCKWQIILLFQLFKNTIVGIGQQTGFNVVDYIICGVSAVNQSVV